MVTDLGTGKISSLHYRFIQAFMKTMKLRVHNSESKEYAMMIILKGQNSAAQYVSDSQWPIKSINMLM